VSALSGRERVGRVSRLLLDEDDITATYDRGILTVSVPPSDAESSEKHVEVYEIAPLEEDTTTSMTMTTSRISRPSAMRRQTRSGTSRNRTTAPDRLPSMGWKPRNSSPCYRDAG
jgi:hypothetical protein